MNSKTQRISILAGAMLIVLLAVTLLLRKKPKPAGNWTDRAEERISAIKRRSTPPKSNPSGSSEVKPVEVNSQTLLGGQAMLGLMPDEVDGILDAEGRDPKRLIAAQAVLGDHRYLREAAESHPDDPEVQFWILAKRVLPEERAAWLEKFKESDPNNALGNYLAAQEAFRSNDFATGIAELKSAGAKGYQDYSDDLQDDVRDLYATSGKFNEAEVRDGSAWAISMPHVDQIQSLAQRLVEHHDRLIGEEKSEEAAELVGLGIGMLETVAGNSRADAIGSRTMLVLMQERLHAAAGDPSGDLAALTAERERVGQLAGSVRAIFEKSDHLDGATLEGYSERLHDLGEVRAAEWLVQQVGEVPSLEE